LERRWWDSFLASFKRYAEREAMATLPAATAEVTVDASPEEAFRIFTEEIGLWWRRGTPYWNDRERGLSVRIEPGWAGASSRCTTSRRAAASRWGGSRLGSRAGDWR
jgi:hypothetical protein